MIDDFLLEVATSLDVQVDDLSAQNVEMAEHRALRQIHRELKPFKLTLQDFNLPVPAGHSNDPDLSLVQMHMQFNREALQQRVDASHSKMNSDQRDVFEAVLKAVEDDLINSHTSKAFFLDSPGGCGKTFTFNLLIDQVRANGGIVLSAASSGIAALLMEGGSTAHSHFKIPVDIGPDMVCNMSLQSQNAELLKAASLIVWDEAPMAHKHSIEAVDATLRDIMGSIRGQEWRRMVPFGGKVIVFAGDFRQILPVVPRGTHAAIVAACLKMSNLWQHIQVRRLTINMRVEMLKNTLGPAAAVSQQQFAELLLKVGEGSADNPFPIPPDWCVPDPSLKGLISDVYGDQCDESACSADYLIKRCILTPKNDRVQEINDKIMDLFKGNDANIQPRIYFSHDYANDEEDVALYPTEFLNSLDPQGLPPHELKLKVGCPIILLRNLNPRKGLANGTRLIVEELRNQLIVAKIVTGSHAGETVCIPRIPLTSSDSKQNPIIFTRRQFPIRPAFAMTINKSQGQTFEKIGIYLPAPCFSHGQLYVAMSRVGQPTGLKFSVKNATEGQAHTENVVYAEVFQ
eukprot:gene18284-24740_t